MLSFEEIEDCFPDGAMTNWTGNTIVNAQWLHDFAHAVAAKEREAWMIAITNEPELPGEMPDEMWDVLRGDRNAATEALRIIVRQTKSGILARGMGSNAKLRGRPLADGPA